MSFKYNDHITIPDDMPKDCKEVLGIWSDKQTKNGTLIIWLSEDNERRGWFLTQSSRSIGRADIGKVGVGTSGWPLENNYPDLSKLIDDGMIPEIYSPNTKPKERYKLVDKGGYYGLEQI